jgi:hypothetical protein
MSNGETMDKMTFRQYMHIERFGNDDVQGIELGGCYIFPKIDGTNASIWWTPDGLQAGSRKRHLSLESDNAGFYEWVLNGNHNISDFFITHKYNKELRLYGEWLVPHALKTYRADTWRKLYVFDVYHDLDHRYLSYDEYKPILDEFQIEYIPPLCIMNNATYDNIMVELENNTYLIQENMGKGEGVVIKNYGYQNRYGRTVWAKIVANEFKDKHRKDQPTVKNMKQMIEQQICDDYISKHLVDKIYAKIVNEMNGWNSRYIKRLLGTVFHDLVNEEIWAAITKMKYPIINFRTLNTLAINKIKQLKPELF